MTKNKIAADNFIPITGTSGFEWCFCFYKKPEEGFRDFLEFETMLTLGLPLFPMGPSPFG